MSNIEQGMSKEEGPGNREFLVRHSTFDISFMRFSSQVRDFGYGHEPPWTSNLRETRDPMAAIVQRGKAKAITESPAPCVSHWPAARSTLGCGRN